MIRKGILMHVNPDCHAEYKKRHDEIFPELVKELKEHGAHNYSIFLDKKRDLLFGYVEIESEERWDQVAQTTACQKWWDFMKDIMPSNPDNSPIAQKLEQVFYLE
ncbi:L-rhamnose mutarotase [Testudinibacter sp. TR-2022]|uniref:L-rhamnose mutarotase n=1 Tax=Testudinibacter sp. TR-2022 TaxID=2585029 RepID=UPI0011182DF0|nr:L-rhamnose mutarotase [Testudinibacter sp. TR-2022]TNH03659.1 L-rhamnose mutarotase [Pasteurellaceae bacterium Phil31]TNH11376.1 L-rhamnose mutarotase [Testudinibacter sp. TR-2022]TNH11880.1 L-rhamnose mutarotase [Testudinibacter sp. TR-2022]TNH16135.1 L-rhamnose mutarotase [Testudinibacter sp. TR-2022]TNH18242.1 L-rhamnose mutarotase [Testudinibacter sp. TR-2022]